MTKAEKMLALLETYNPAGVPIGVLATDLYGADNFETRTRVRRLARTLRQWGYRVYGFAGLYKKCIEPRDLAVVARPENNADAVTEDAVVGILSNAEQAGFGAAILDLGVDVRAPFWEGLVKRADVSFLVLDTDAKALDRARRFLAASFTPLEGWVLVVNQRTARGECRADKLVRNLEMSSVTRGIVTVPFTPAKKRNVEWLPS